jgi:hypothetical protein
MKIKSIKRVSCNSKRYDIQTSTNNFFANGVLVHNSMIRSFRVGNNIRWGTKMGVTDVSMQAEEYVAKNPRYEHMAAEFLAQNMTPIFEWCSRSSFEKIKSILKTANWKEVENA